MPRVTDWTGISKTPTGYIVRVKVGHLPRAVKRYPAGTPLEDMQRWRDRARRDLEDELEKLPEPPRRGAPPRHTLAADVKEYLKAWGTGKHANTVAQRERHLEDWVQAFPERSRRSLTVGEIEQHLAAWQKKNPLGRKEGAATWNKRRQALLQLFAFFCRGTDKKNIVEDVPTRDTGKPQPRGLPIPVVRELLEVMLPSATRARLGVMAFTGLRPEELRRITPEDVDLKAGKLYVRTAKGGKAATVPLLSEATTWLREFHELGAYGPFTSAPMGLSLRRAVKAVNRRRAAKKLPPLGPIRAYDFRHSFGTAFYAATRDLKATSEALRNTLAMAERYVEAAVSPVLQAGVALLEGALGAPPPDPQSDPHGVRKAADHGGKVRKSAGARKAQKRAKRGRKVDEPR